MSAVVEAVEGIGDGINKYIVEPIKNDPLTFFATMAAATFAGPGAFGITGLGYGSVGMGVAAGIGNTAAGLAQGEDFDEAVKGGAIAGLTTFAGIEGSQYLKNTFGTAPPPVENRALTNAFNGLDKSIDASITQSTGDLLASGAKQSANFLDEAAVGSTSNPAASWSQSVAKAGASVADDAASAGSLLDDGFNAAGNPNPTGMPDASLQGTGNLKADLYGNQNPNYGTSSNSSPVVVKDAGQGVYNSSMAGVKPSVDLPNNVLDFDDPLYYLKAQNAAESAAANKVLDTAGTNASVLNSPVGRMGTGYVSQSPPVQTTMWDKALGYGKDAYDLVSNNKLYTGAALLGLASLGNKDEPPEGGNNEQIGDPGFYDPMRLYNYNRQPISYAGDITQYGRTGGEHQFFTPTVYEPIQYAAGGSVAPDNYGYYTYGNIPKTMKGFAQGGLSALAKGGNFDGRSDDIPAVLSDGEFVIDAETVALLGNGSSKAGANRLEEMRQAVRKQKGGALSRGQFSPDAKSPLAYLKSSKKSRG